MEVGTVQAQALQGVQTELFRPTGDMHVFTEGPERIRALNDSPPDIHELTLRVLKVPRLLYSPRAALLTVSHW